MMQLMKFLVSPGNSKFITSRNCLRLFSSQCNNVAESGDKHVDCKIVSVSK